MTLYVEAIDAEELTTLEGEWEALIRECEPRNPFTSALWIRLWWKHFQRERLWSTDFFFVHVVRNEKGQLIAVIPTILVYRPAFGPFKLRIIRFVGADTSLTEVRGIICRRSDEGAVYRAVRDFLSKKSSLWDIVEWTGVRPEGDAKAVLEAESPLKLQITTPMYVRSLPDNWKSLLASVSSNMRKNVRKAYEALQSSGLKTDFRVIERAQDIDSALDRFFALHSLRASAAGMVVHPDKFLLAKNRSFMKEYINAIAKCGYIRIFELRIDEKVVASRLAFLLDDTLYFYYAGYDPHWKNLSVMTVLMAEALKWSIDSGVKTANLSSGRDLSKLRWKPAEIKFESYVQVAPSARARLLGAAYVGLLSFRQRRLLRPQQISATQPPMFRGRVFEWLHLKRDLVKGDRANEKSAVSSED
jgi:CelD/BcsL family acetyltransferase involved in cellulose biosynthesis